MESTNSIFGNGVQFNLVVTNAIPFVDAAEDGELEKVKEILRSRHGVEEILSEEAVVLGLHRAAENNHDRVVEVILNSYPSLSVSLLADKVHRDLDIKPLHIAAWTGQVKQVKKQLQEGTDVNAHCKGDISALHMAAFRGHLEVVNVLLERIGVKLDAVTAEGHTVLHMAADGGQAEVVQVLLSASRKALRKASADFINAKDCLQRNALHYASRHGHSAVVKVLLADPEIDVNPKDEVGKFTPLHVACWMPGDQVEVVKLLIHHAQIQINAKVGTGAISESALEEMAKVSWKLLRPQLVDATVHSTVVFAREGFEKRGDTALHLAAEVGNVNIVTELLLHGAIEVNAVEEQYGTSPLHCAALWGRNLEVLAKLLADQRVDVMMRTQGLRFYPDKYSQCDYMTAVHIAAYRGQSDILGILLNDLRTGMLLNTKTGSCNFILNGHHYKGMTSLHLAAYWGHEDVLIQLLSQYKLNVNAHTEFHILKHGDKCSARLCDPHVAAYRDHLGVLRQILTAPGVDQDRLNHLMKMLSGSRVGPALQALRQLLASGTAEVQNAQTRVEALINRASHPKNSSAGLPPTQFSRQLHADRCYSNMSPLHIAAHRGQLDVFTRMLEIPALELNAQTSTGDTVLHIAIYERRIHIINLVCGERKLQANMRNQDKQRALQLVWYEWQEAMDCLLGRKDVRMFMERMFQDKQSFHNAANALIVGGSLIASVTFGGFLQPPFGGAFGTYRPWAVRGFWSFNTLSFFFAVYTLVLSIRIVMPKPEHFIEKEVKKLRKGIAYTSSSLTISTAFVIGAFVTAGLGNLPPNTWLSMLLSSIVGGMFLVFFAVIPMLKDYVEWFGELLFGWWQRRTPGANGLYIDLQRSLRAMGRTFSRGKRAKTEYDITTQTPQEPPPGPSQALHPHRTIPLYTQATIFSTQRPVNLKSGRSALTRHVPIAHKRFPSM